MNYYVSVSDQKAGKLVASKEVSVTKTSEGYTPTTHDFFSSLRSMGIKEKDKTVFDKQNEVRNCLGKSGTEQSGVIFDESNVRRTKSGTFGTLSLSVLTDDEFNHVLNAPRISPERRLVGSSDAKTR